MSEICILYCLTKRKMTIYSVRKNISEYFGAFTKPSHGTIHPALKKLAEAGYVTAEDILSEGGKKSCYYSITEKGKKYFTELMLGDFSDNPSVFMNEIHTRLAAMGALSNEAKEELKHNSIQLLDLYVTETKRATENEYLGLDEYQKAIMKQNISSTELLIKYISEIK